MGLVSLTYCLPMFIGWRRGSFIILQSIPYTVLQKSSIKDPLVSVIVRCKDESIGLQRLFRGLESQLNAPLFEVLIIDSGSKDDTIKIALGQDCTVYTIAASDFSYSSSINLGASLARGRACVFVSAHAYPNNEQWLAELCAPVLQLSDVAGCYSRQLYSEDAPFLERIAIDSAFPAREGFQAISNECHMTTKRFHLPNRTAMRQISFSNASSCVRRDLMLSVPARSIPASEDRVWAHDVMLKGYRVKYAAKSEIIHCHDENPQQWYRRIFLNSEALNLAFGIRTPIALVIPIFFKRLLNDISYQHAHRADRRSSNMVNAIRYEWLYALAHYRGGRATC